MHVRKLLLAAAVLGMTALPAHAEEPTVAGHNTGDDGVITLLFGGLPAGSKSDQINTFPTDGTVSAQCEYHQQNRPSSNDAILIVEGHAQAAPKGTVRAVSTGVECKAVNLFTGAIAIQDQSANESTATAWLPPKTAAVQSSSWRVCAKATVHWSDNSVTVSTDWSCI